MSGRQPGWLQVGCVAGSASRQLWLDYFGSKVRTSRHCCIARCATGLLYHTHTIRKYPGMSDPPPPVRCRRWRSRCLMGTLCCAAMRRQASALKRCSASNSRCVFVFLSNNVLRTMFVLMLKVELRLFCLAALLSEQLKVRLRVHCISNMLFAQLTCVLRLLP